MKPTVSSPKRKNCGELSKSSASSPSLLECGACFASTRLAQVAGVVIFCGHEAESGLPHQLGRGVRRSKAQLVLRRTFCGIADGTSKLPPTRLALWKRSIKTSCRVCRRARLRFAPRACPSLVDLHFHQARHHDVARKQQTKIAGGRLGSGRRLGGGCLLSRGPVRDKKCGRSDS